MSKIRIAIDRGGTFTDCIANPGSGNPDDDVVIKLLSVDPRNYPDAPLEGIRRLLEICEKKKIPRGQKLDISGVESIRMGTTLATNCALERTGERCALVTTKGFKDALVIGNQTRPDIFDLAIKRPGPLYETVVEIDERVTLTDVDSDDIISRKDKDLRVGKSGETVHILKKINEDEVRATLKILYATGIRSLAVSFLHSFTYQEHEQVVGRIAKEIGFEHISLSSEISPMIKFIPRANSAVADSYLTPVIKSYLNGIESGLSEAQDTRIQFMQSDGGLVDSHKFSGLRAILSGPAGGVVGYSATCYDPETNIPLIGFDMGGTSTDVSRFGDGKLEHIFETLTAGIVIQTPQLDINTVAAGGSSRLFWKNGLFKVGPESAAAHPGPACYRKGGPLTITDANLFLGRLVPELFPSIFGPNEDEPLDIEATTRAFEEMTDHINKDMGSSLAVDEVAYGFLKVANESMARPIRTLTEAKGHVISNHRLVSFGGAGGQHAVSIAETLGIDTVLIHRYSSILSAYGMFLADVVEEAREPCSYILDESSSNSMSLIYDKIDKLMQQCTQILLRQGFSEESIKIERFLNLRYEGTETSLMVSQDKDDNRGFAQKFHELHQAEFGFRFEDKNIIVDDVRVRATGLSNVRQEESIDAQLSKISSTLESEITLPEPLFTKPVMFENGWIETPVYSLDHLKIGSVVKGPAIIADGTQTNLLTPNSVGTILKSHIFIRIQENKPTSSTTSNGVNSHDVVDPVLLSIFGHRFMDIAEQMGNQLRKTSVSTNVKERLDFSCALFDKDGNLVANAPHVPVHLGSMSTCIKKQAQLWKNKLNPGDSIVTNHPDVGGTHLPDITVITPSFDKTSGELIFYVASRAHHADIGGILPGSMPPNSKELFEEGAAIYSEKLVENGKFDEKKVVKLFFEDPAQYPGCSGSRKLADNISDLKAQIAANTKGIMLVSELVKEFGFNEIEKYMHAIQKNASDTVKKTLKIVAHQLMQSQENLSRDSNNDVAIFESSDFMDDGTKICLKIMLDPANEKFTFDFTGTTPQVYGNLNAPEAITFSATLYVLRCLVNEEIPLNQGCLDPVDIIIPVGSVLSPRQGAAVVGGNVMTSQRVTDVILKALGVQADSQGDCNNLTFGNDNFGYYETICGGHGAGCFYWRKLPGQDESQVAWNGTSAVHTNMTNTRMTDVEIFERHYPVILRQFSIRSGSGGIGRFTGGNGVVRDIEFTEPVQASILSERRVNPPHGLNGGHDADRGVNLWVQNKTQSVVNLGGRNTINAQPGDRIIIMTPGGGGYGVPDA